MKFEIYFFMQVCVHNNFSKWKSVDPLYAIGCYKQKQCMDFLIWKSMNPYSQHFSLMHNEHLLTIFKF